MHELTTLHTKLDKLLKKYTALQAEKEALQQTLHAQNEKVELLNKKLATLEEEVNLAKTGDAISSGKEDKSAVRKQLNALIGDIDKLLASLND